MWKTRHRMRGDDGLRRRQGASGEGVGSPRGQTTVEVSMMLGFLVALAVFVNRLVSPLIFEAFHNIAKAVSVIGP